MQRAEVKEASSGKRGRGAKSEAGPRRVRQRSPVPGARPGEEEEEEKRRRRRRRRAWRRRADLGSGGAGR